MNLEIALCADGNMEETLHVASSSVLARVAPGRTTVFHLILSGFTVAQKDLLRRTLDQVGRPYQINFITPPDEYRFRGFHPLHGNLVTYYRLVLPELVDADDRLLYLDSDTISYMDVSPLMEVPMPYACGFVERGVVSHYPEYPFFSRLGLGPETLAFNAGVMLFDLKTWRAEDRTRQLLDFCRKYSRDLYSSDQTALIAHCGGKFTRLEQRFNMHLYVNDRAQDPELNPGIYHFVGSPKPWDLAGRYLHGNFSLYQRAVTATSFQRHRSEIGNVAAWKRAFRIRGGYMKSIRNRLTRP